MPGEDLGEYYTIPVILSMAGIEKQANTAISKQMGNIGQQSSQAFTKGFVSEARSSEQQIKRMSENYQKLYDRAADAAGKLKVAQAGVNDNAEKGITSGKRYEAAIAAQQKATRDHARALKTATDAYKDMEDAAKRATNAGDGVARGAVSGLRGVGGEAVSAGREAAGGFVDGFAGASALTRLGAAGGPIGIALAAAAVVAIGAGKVLGDNIAIGMQQVAIQDRFQARLGIDDESMKNVARGAAKAYVDVFGQSVEENLQTAQFAFQAGLINSKSTEEDAKKVIEQIDTIRNVSDADAKEIARSMSQLVKTGLAGDVAEAADAITAGFQRGFDISGDWLDSITEYSTQFRAVGLDIADVMGLTQQALEGGAPNVDKAVDALKEFAIRAKDGSETTQNAFRALDLDVTKTAEDIAAGGPKARAAMDKVLDRIREIPNAYDQGLVAAALFGTQWEDLQGAFNNLDLDKAKAAIGDFTGSTDKAMKTAADNAETSWDEAGRHIEDTFRSLRMKIADWFKFIPDTFNSLFDKPGFSSGDRPTPNNPVARDNILLPPTSTPGPTPVPGLPAPAISPKPGRAPELAPGLAIPGLGIAPNADGTVPIDLSGGAGGGKGLPGLMIPLPAAPASSSSPSIATAPRKVGSDSGLLPQTVSVKDSIATKFGAITDIGGYREDANFPNEHPSGKAIDVMVPNWNTPQGKAYGDQIAAEALKQPGVQYVLWQQRQYNADGTSSAMEDRGGSTANHMDHVHVHVEPAGADTSGTVKKSSGSAPMSMGPGGSSGLGPGPVSPAVHNAFGSKYEPGIGTPGYNDYGEPGYYETDPRRIAQAQRSAEDSARRIGDADQRIIDADKAVVDAQAERDRIAKMSEVERTIQKADLGKANDDLRRAKAQAEQSRIDASRSREDAQWAQDDLAEAQKGTFRQAREAKKQKQSQSDSKLGEIGSIAGSFLKNTLGIGSWLPDLANNPYLKGADALAGSAVEMFNAYANGEWQPGGLLGSAMGFPPDSTSGAAFGMPDVTAPPMPAGGQHPGSGAAPGPAPQINVDASTNVAGNVGWDPEQINKDRDSNLYRAVARIPIG